MEKNKKETKKAEQFLVSIIALGDVLDSLLGRLDLIGILIGDLDRELLLDGHDNLDSVQRVQSEISVEVGLEGDLCTSRVLKGQRGEKGEYLKGGL